jgi:ABC-type branched-subunit amino acid transport system ATPase component
MTDPTPLLVTEGLTLHYGAAQALFGISLSVGKGETVALVGANGAGKSSFLKAILGLLPATGGRILFDGEDVTRLSTRRRVTGGMALCPEGREVFPGLTVRENLELGALAQGISAAEMGLRVEGIYSRFPRLRERHTQTAGTLSGGEQQMLVIGRALMAAPRLLLLDEPSLGLAPLVADEIFECLQELARSGMTILLIEQNAARALCGSTRAYVLANGRVVREGPSRELLVDPDLHRAFLGGAPEPSPVDVGDIEGTSPVDACTRDTGAAPSGEGPFAGLEEVIALVPGLGREYRAHRTRSSGGREKFRLVVERGQGVEKGRGVELARELSYQFRRRFSTVPAVEVVEYGSLPRAAHKRDRLIEG